MIPGSSSPGAEVERTGAKGQASSGHLVVGGEHPGVEGHGTAHGGPDALEEASGALSLRDPASERRIGKAGVRTGELTEFPCLSFAVCVCEFSICLM